MPKNREMSDGQSIFSYQTLNHASVSERLPARERRWLVGLRWSRARISLTYIEGKFRENLTRKIKNFGASGLRRRSVLGRVGSWARATTDRYHWPYPTAKIRRALKIILVCPIGVDHESRDGFRWRVSR